MDIATRRSRGGRVVLMNGGPIIFRSALQRVIPICKLITSVLSLYKLSGLYSIDCPCHLIGPLIGYVRMETIHYVTYVRWLHRAGQALSLLLLVKLILIGPWVGENGSSCWTGERDGGSGSGIRGEGWEGRGKLSEWKGEGKMESVGQ